MPSPTQPTSYTLCPACPPNERGNSTNGHCFCSAPYTGDLSSTACCYCQTPRSNCEDNSLNSINQFYATNRVSVTGRLRTRTTTTTRSQMSFAEYLNSVEPQAMAAAAELNFEDDGSEEIKDTL